LELFASFSRRIDVFLWPQSYSQNHSFHFLHHFLHHWQENTPHQNHSSLLLSFL
jgi:uncharacterized protein Usg